VWESLKQVLDFANGNEDIWSMENLMKIRNQALEIWT